MPRRDESRERRPVVGRMTEKADIAALSDQIEAVASGNWLYQCKDCNAFMRAGWAYWHLRRGCFERAYRLAHIEEARRNADICRALDENHDGQEATDE